MSDGMAALQRGNDPFDPGQLLEGVERFVIGGKVVFDPALLLEPGMLGTDCGVIETGAD